MKKLLLTLVAMFVVVAANAWTVTYTNPSGWDKVYAYTYSDETLGGWPGTEMTKSGDVWTISGTGTSTNIIFNNGNSGSENQTADLTLTDGAQYTNPSISDSLQGSWSVKYINSKSWETVYVYAYTDDATITDTWPGTQMTNSNGVWTYSGKGTPSIVIFNNGNGGEGNQTANLDYVEGATYNFDGITDDAENDDVTLYVVGANINGAEEWGAGTDNVMNFENGIYTWSGTELGSSFKIYNGEWGNDYELGSNGSSISLDTPYYYGVKGSNIAFANPANYLVNPTVTLNMNAGTITVTGTFVEGGVSFTLAGDFNGWNGNDKNYELKAQGNDIYAAVLSLNFPGDDYNFQVVLNGQTWYGNVNNEGEYDMSNTTVSHAIGTGYQNNLWFTNYEGGELEFTLNSATMTLTISTDTTAIETLEGDNGEDVIYNLQGVRVNNPSKGLYIINGKKVLVK